MRRIVETLLQDVRYGMLQFGRSPGLAATIVLSLALGVGANTALFTAVNAVMLRGAPVSDPARLLAFGWVKGKDNLSHRVVRSQSGGGTYDRDGRNLSLSFPYPSFRYIREHTRALSTVAGFAPIGVGPFSQPAAVIRGEAMSVNAEMVTGEYFRTVGIGAAIGRVIGRADEDDAAPRVAVLSDAFFTRRFGRDRSVVGSTIAINRVPVTVVGVAPRGFTGLTTGRLPDLWIPLTLEGALAPWLGATDRRTFRQAGYWWLQVVGRLAHGVSEERARAEFADLLRASYADLAPDAALKDVPQTSSVPAAAAYNDLRTPFSTPLGILGVAVAAILLVGCANVATLLLVRTSARRKEMSVRLALGASRGRLVRQLVTEHALYAVAGALLGLLGAAWGARLLLALVATRRLGVPVAVEIGLDARVLGFTGAVAILTTLLSGALPALCATRVELTHDLKDAAGGCLRNARFGRFRLGRLFVAVQIALTVPLVVGASLFVRTLVNLQHEHVGFSRERVLLFSLDAAKAGYTGDGVPAAHEQLRQAIEAAPGVTAASFSVLSLVSGLTNNGTVRVEGRPTDGEGREREACWNAVAPHFLDAMGMRLLAGRPLDGRDTRGAPKVALVNETMVRTFFGGANPIGARFSGRRVATAADMITVVGVVADAKYRDLRGAAPPTYFVPYAQIRWTLGAVWYEVRATGDPLALVGRVREIARRHAPGAPLGDVKTQSAQIAASLSRERMFAWLFSFFGATALLLACLGLQGTQAYTLRRRTREIGIRMALGAAPRSVVGMALRETLAMTVAGLMVGGALAAGGARFVASLLFGVTPLNVATLATSALAMVAVSLVAGYLPARRAAAMDPLKALRED